MGIKIQKTTPLALPKQEKSSVKGNIFGFFRLSNKKKEAFYAELSLLLNSGVRLKEAFGISIASKNSASHIEFLEGLKDGIDKGIELSVAMRESGHFSDYECYSIAIGEETGNTNEVCENLATYYERRNEQKRLIVGSLTYPLIVIGITVLVVAVLLRFVVPIFQDMFAQNDVPLPPITQVVINFSEFLKKYGVFLIFGIFLLIYGLKYFGKKASFKLKLDQLQLYIPFVGKVVKASHMARFLDAMTLLVSSKVTIPESITMSSKMVSFLPLKNALDDVYSKMLSGGSLASAFKETSFFDNQITALIRVAEETNESEKVFAQLAKQYNRSLNHKSKQLMLFIQPLLLLVVGIIVGIIVIAMYMPLFKMGSVFE